MCVCLHVAGWEKEFSCSSDTFMSDEPGLDVAVAQKGPKIATEGKLNSNNRTRMSMRKR